MAKATLQVHMHDEGNGIAHPAVNVKVYGQWGPSLATLAERYSISEEDAQALLTTVYESTVADFWGFPWAQHVPSHLGGKPKVYSEGRSGGWLVVHNLPDVELWTKRMYEAWAKFEKGVLDDIAYRSTDEYIFDMIEANEWHTQYQAKPPATFTLTLSCENAAFEDAMRNREVARILSDLAVRVTHSSDEEFTLRDVNGNKVGTAQFTSV